MTAGDTMAKVNKPDSDTLVVEEGGIIQVKTGGKIVPNDGTQAAHIADASTAHELNEVFSNTEAEGALDALGTKINSILAALEGAGHR